MRLDQYLKTKFKISRHRAQEMIQSAHVEVNQKITTKASYDVDLEKDVVEIKNKELLRYVSRGGLKLEAALNKLQISVEGKSCLDLGQSTGGFTDCLLQKGASQIIGIDVGKDQLEPSLRENEKVEYYEGLHLKDAPTYKVDLLVCDLSFISTIENFSLIDAITVSPCEMLFLIKPQFELGSEALNKKGLVKNKEDLSGLEEKAKKSSQQVGWQVIDYIESQIKGRDGNQEYFLYAKK